MSQLQNVRNVKKQDTINRILFSKIDDNLYNNLSSIYGTIENLTNISLHFICFEFIFQVMKVSCLYYTIHNTRRFVE